MNGFFGMNNNGCCNDGCQDNGRSGFGCDNNIWLILLLLCCGCIDCNCLIWIILLSCCNGGGFGCGR